MASFRGKSFFRGKKIETPTIRTFYFDKPSGFQFIPGQHIVLRFTDLKGDPRGNMRQFSLTSDPENDLLSITTKTVNRDSLYKKRLENLQPGDEVEIAGPIGNFVLDSSSEDLVLICGGIGITPFISMLRHNLHNEERRKIELIHSTGSKVETPFYDEIGNMCSTMKNLTIHRFLTREMVEEEGIDNGRITSEKLARTIGNIAGKQFYVCGPPSFVKDVREILSEGMGVEEINIRSEDFYGY